MVVEAGRKKIGLVVDELLGQQQVVVKSLEKNLHKVEGLMGATILGDGRVAPIIDVTALSELNLFSVAHQARTKRGNLQAWPSSQPYPQRWTEERPHVEWFKNLNARPRLMLSFGLLLLLTLVMGCLAISRLNRANDRLVALYQLDLLGVVVIDDLVIHRTSIGGFMREAMLDADSPTAIAENEKKVFSAFATMHTDLDQAKGLFYVKAGMAAMETIRSALPGYEQAHHVIFERVKAHDLVGAKATLVVANDLGAPIAAAVDRARAMKKELTAEKFATSMASYQSARSQIIAFVAASLILGFLLSIFIARGFSVPLGEAVAALELVAAGDLTTSVPVHTRDEVGRMAGGLESGR